MLADDSTVVVAQDQVACELEGEAIILNSQSGIYYGLSAVGLRIWSLLQQPNRVAAIRTRLVEEYDVDQGRCAQDLSVLLEDMAGSGLIEVRPG